MLFLIINKLLKLQITIKFQKKSLGTIRCYREKGVYTLKKRWQDHTGNTFSDVTGTIVQRKSFNRSINHLDTVNIMFPSCGAPSVRLKGIVLYILLNEIFTAFLRQ